MEKNKISIPCFDPLGIIEEITRDAPLRLYDPIAKAIKDAWKEKHSDSGIRLTEATYVTQRLQRLRDKGYIP